MHQIVLDTETTGLSAQQGHRIIEIGCVELIHRRLTGKSFHVYLQPDREIEAGAIAVHGITNDFLKDKPRFLDIMEEFKEFIKGKELIIHNAPFDVSFIENEFLLLKEDNWQKLNAHCLITDTLLLARQKHPGQRNNLDALCKRYGIDNTHREKHGALMDAEILAQVYLAMTGGQETLFQEETPHFLFGAAADTISNTPLSSIPIPVIRATDEENSLHHDFLNTLEEKIQGECVWRTLEKIEG